MVLLRRHVLDSKLNRVNVGALSNRVRLYHKTKVKDLTLLLLPPVPDRKNAEQFETTSITGFSAFHSFSFHLLASINAHKH